MRQVWLKVWYGLAFVCCWIVLSLLLLIWLKPERRAVTATPTLFDVCVMAAAQPVRMPLADWRQQPLCTQPQEWTHSGTAAIRWRLQQQGDEWTLSSWNDSPADPLVFHYRTSQRGGAVEITPLWVQHGGLLAKILAFLFGFPLTFLIGLPLLQFIRHRRKTDAGHQAT